MTPELFGYAEPLTARPGTKVRVMVSDDRSASYEATLVRLLAPDFGPAATPMREQTIEHPINGRYEGSKQFTPIGSYGVVDQPLELRSHGQFTIAMWVQPTLHVERPQTLMAIVGKVAGYEVALAAGELVLLFANAGIDATIRSGLRLERHTWYLLAVGVDSGTGVVTFQVDAWTARFGFATRQFVEVRHVGLVSPPTAQITIAATRRGGRALRHFNGKLESPHMYSAVLRPDVVRTWAKLDEAPPDLVLAAFDLGPPTDGPGFYDHGPQNLHGRLVNCPGRAVTGHRWDGTVFDFRFAPDQYRAVHFHEDDLADACWTPSVDLALSVDFPSGVYAIKLGRDGQTHSYVPFFVTAPSNRRARAAILLPTATYIAYGNHVTRLSATRAERVSGAVNVVEESELALLDHPEFGASTYDSHPDGSGVVYVSRLRPMMNMRPSGRAWNFALDMCLVDWLDRNGVAADIITDEDLHFGGADALSGYQLVMTGCHPEYVSTPMMDALEAFTKVGGRLMYLGGNGFYWRIAMSEAFKGVLEVRRGKEGTRLWSGAVGEDHHSLNGEAGGTWRSLGRPPNALLGVGYVGQGFDCAAPYRRTAESYDPRVAFMFEGVTEDTFGKAGIVPGGAGGLEIDAANMALATPAHTLVVARSFNHSNAYVPSVDEIEVNFASADATSNPAVRAEMSFHEVGKAGAVFSTGSIAYLGALTASGGDDFLSTITLNVVRRFLNPAPFIAS